MFFLGGGMLIMAVLIVAAIGWVIWYFKELPKNIRELKESKEQYRNCDDPSASHKEQCRIEYKGSVGVILFFSGITILAAIYAVRSITGLAVGIIQAFHR